MKRYFYTCPIEAELMNKKFGFRYQNEYGVTLYSLGRNFYTSAIHDTDDHGPTNMLHQGKFYIHPESLHLLKPQVGDIYTAPTKYGTYVETVKSLPCPWSTKRHKIIQRDGKPFFWPEVEK